MRTWNIELKHVYYGKYIQFSNLLLKAYTWEQAREKAIAFMNDVYFKANKPGIWLSNVSSFAENGEAIFINNITKTTKKAFGDNMYKKCFKAFRLDEKGRIVK